MWHKVSNLSTIITKRSSMKKYFFHPPSLSLSLILCVVTIEFVWYKILCSHCFLYFCAEWYTSELVGELESSGVHHVMKRGTCSITKLILLNNATAIVAT